MKTKLIQIGDQKAIVVPESLIVQAGLTEAVEIHVVGREIIVQSAVAARAGWEEAFRTMHQHGDDMPLDITLESTTQDWDNHEWTW
jgi:antitoxin component of MazEF toxin-antitoxin module